MRVMLFGGRVGPTAERPAAAIAGTAGRACKNSIFYAPIFET
jgi:hypothetical protein